LKDEALHGAGNSQVMVAEVDVTDVTARFVITEHFSVVTLVSGEYPCVVPSVQNDSTLKLYCVLDSNPVAT